MRWDLPLGTFDQALDWHMVKVGGLVERAYGVVTVSERTREVTQPNRAHGVAVAGPPFNVTPRTNQHGASSFLRTSTAEKRGEEQTRPAEVAYQTIPLNLCIIERPVIITIFLLEYFVE